MDDTPLATKLHIPPPCQLLVFRPRLTAALSKALTSSLTLVSAPAGYGKSTLVSSWLREANVHSAWLSLDEGDNDPICFSQYFILVLQKIIPAIRPELLGVLQEKQPTPFKAMLNIIVNEIDRHTTTSVLVLDDFHAIHAQPILEMITHLLDLMPPQMHLVLISRTDPPLPLSRLRVRNQLVEIRANQLRFKQEEIAIYLNEAMGLTLSTGDITALETRTEGWIAGLQLASIAMQGGKDVHRFVSEFTGSHYYIMDYLAEEVLSLQSDTVRSFLLKTSILERMCGPLCNAVVEEDLHDNPDGQLMLETLEQMNLFLIPLDEERRWYRYHHLFADVLNRYLEQQLAGQLPNLHRRASRWYENNGLIYDAIHHALMAGDLEHAAQLVDQYGCNLLMRGEVVNLLRWIEAVEPYSQTHPWIAIQKAWALCLTGQLDRAEIPLQTAERLVSALEVSDAARTMSGAVTAARAYRANMQGESHLAADLTRQALDCLPASSDLSCSLRSVATSILGDASWMNGNLVEAQRGYTDAVMISQAIGNIHIIIIANANLADILLEQGRLHQAARIFSEIFRLAVLPDGQVSPLIERAYAGMSRISYEWNHLEEAAEYVHRCIDLSKRWGSIEYQAIGYSVLAGLELGQGNLEKAQEAMDAAERFVTEHPLTPWRGKWLKSALARSWIARGNLGRAFDLVQESGIQIDGIPHTADIPYLQEPGYLILLRLHLAQGEFDAALALSELLLSKLEAASRRGRVIEILVLRSLACQGKKDMDQALSVLESALSLAQPEGYTRIFLDEGEPMAKLLFQAKARRISQGYTSELLSAFGGLSGTELPPPQLLIEPLTIRELEVLKLIEEGYSNQDIADKLVISMPTVKRHISNIYAKMGVESRTQAVSLGKELKLFE